MPPKRTRSTKQRGPPPKLKQQTLFAHFSSSPPPPDPKRQGARATIKSKAPKQVIDSDSDVPHSKPLIRQIKRKNTNAKLKRKIDSDEDQEEDTDSSDAGKIKFEAQTSSARTDSANGSESEEDEEGENLAPSSPVRPGKRKLVFDSDPELSETVNGKSSNTSRKRSKPKVQHVHEIESDEEEQGKLRKSRFVKGERPIHEQDDDDVLDGIDEERIIENRFRGPKKNTYLENLERLKRRKQTRTGSKSEKDSSKEDVIPGARKGRDENDEETSESSNEDEKESNGDSDVDNFIVEDDDQQEAHLPAIFSMNTHQDLIHHFKIVSQYMVHLALTDNSARSRMAERLIADDYFSVSVAIARRKVMDVRDSIVSSVWRTEFKKALQTYPEFKLYDLEFAIPECHACNLGGRLSKFVGRLSGEPYDKKTFQAMELEASDGNESDSSTGDKAGPPEFHLGRFCASRTEIYHELCHWEYSLFTALLNEVEILTGRGRSYIRITTKNKPPDDITDADQVMEWLDERGIISTLWLDLKNAMSRATNLEADAKRGNADDFA